ncbi:MAG: hypothetical protein QNK62_00680 [Cryomorphaceae bacterium]|jgi:hypothetical protein
MTSPTPAPPADYLALRKTHYGAYPDYDLQEQVLRQAWSFFIHQPEAVWYNGRTFCFGLYRMDTDTLAFGFFETKTDDFDAFKEEWDTLRDAYPEKWAGPLQGSTFLPYRFVTYTDHSACFPGEWRTLPHYAQWMEQLAPTDVTHYRSAYRTDYESVIHVSAPFVQDWEEQGFHLVSIQVEQTEERAALHHMIGAIFHGNWGYKALNELEFNAWANNIGQTHGGTPWIYWIQIETRRVGFAYLFLLHDGTLIFKTIGLLPEFQAQKMGNAVAGKLHQMAAKSLVLRCIYALVQTENRVNRMPDPDITVFRKYATFEFDPVST